MMAGVPGEGRLICETFEQKGFHPLLKWLNPPPSWNIDAEHGRLLLETAGETDFWQRTHYGFRADNGHFLHAEVGGDGEVSATIRAWPVHQYDQAGLMVRSNEDCWLKASAEYERGKPNQLGAVVTNHGYSDWSLQAFPGASPISYCLRVRWEGSDFFVEQAPAEAGPWQLMRVAHLFRTPDRPLLCGIYACSPKAAGFRVEFRSLRIQEFVTATTDLSVDRG